MPVYRAAQERHTEWNGFEDADHLIDFLLKTEAEGLYHTHFQSAADAILKGTRTTPYRLSKRGLKLVRDNHPRALVYDVLSQMKQRRGNEQVGGGIIEVFQSLGREMWNLVGGPALTQWIGGKKKRKKIPRQAQIFAEAVDATYKKPDKRPDNLYGLVRLEQYDSDRCAVWKEQNGDVLLTVHGTQGMGDVVRDVGIFAGGTARSTEVENLVRRLLNDGYRVDVGGHSLATQFLTNMPDSLKNQIDEFYLYNPASSPVESNKYLKSILNLERANWFVNPSDLVSSGLYNKMSNEFVEKHVYLGGYRWSPLTAHGLGQWSADIKKEDEETVAKNYQETSVDKQKNAEQSYRAHLRGLAKLQMAAENKEKQEAETKPVDGVLTI